MYSTYPPDYQKNANEQQQQQQQQQYGGPPSSQPQLPGSYSHHSNPSPRQPYPSAGPPSAGYGNPPSYSSADFSQHTPPTPAVQHQVPIQQSVSAQNPAFQIQQRQPVPKNANAKAARIQQVMSRKSVDFHRVSAQMPNASHPSSPLANPQQQQQQQQHPNRQQQYGHDFNNSVETSPQQQQIQNVTISPANRNQSQNEIFQQQNHQQQQQQQQHQGVNPAKTGDVWMSDYSALAVGDRQPQNAQVAPFRVPPSNPADGNEAAFASEDQPRRQFSHPVVQPHPSTPLKSADQFAPQMESQPPPQRIYIHQQIADESRRVAAGTAINGKIYFRQGYDQGNVQQMQHRPVTMHAPQQLVAYNQQFIGSPVAQQTQYPGVIGSQRLYVNQTMIANQTQQQHQQQQIAVESSFTRAVVTGDVKPKKAYRELKKKFKYMIYENEYYQEELRNLQRKLLKLSRDKNFLLDRLQGYEHVSNSSDDSDASIKTVEEQPQKIKRRTTTSVRSGVLNSGRKRGSLASADNGGTSYVNCGTSKATNYYSNAKTGSSSAQNQRYGIQEQRLSQTEDRIPEPKSYMANQSNYSKGNRHHFTNSDQQRNIGAQTQEQCINSDVPTKGSVGNGTVRRLSNTTNVSTKRRHSVVANNSSITSIKSNLLSTDVLNCDVANSGKPIKKETPSEKINVAFLSPEHEMGKDSLDEYMPAVIVSCAAPSSSSSSFTINNDTDFPKRKFVKRNDVDSSIYNARASKLTPPLKIVNNEVAEGKETISTDIAQILENPKSPTKSEPKETRTVQESPGNNDGST